MKLEDLPLSVCLNRSESVEYRFQFKRDGSWWTFTQAETLDQLRKNVERRVQATDIELPTDISELRVTCEVTHTSTSLVGELDTRQWVTPTRKKGRK